ncbi:DUF4124 domain-containing protein [Acinetobacter soli]|uniref:DUF4124 domain-containing protein n=1 Tax=Acinetobacter soli TaxID=487316 RepID=UPI003AA9D98C
MLLSSVAFTTNTLYAQSYYKWIDAQGSTHYTKTPPPEGAKKQGKVDTYSSQPHHHLGVIQALPVRQPPHLLSLANHQSATSLIAATPP